MYIFITRILEIKIYFYVHNINHYLHFTFLHIILIMYFSVVQLKYIIRKKLERENNIVKIFFFCKSQIIQLLKFRSIIDM